MANDGKNFCANCGGSLEEKANFCPQCGTACGTGQRGVGVPARAPVSVPLSMVLVGLGFVAVIAWIFLSDTGTPSRPSPVPVTLQEQTGPVAPALVDPRVMRIASNFQCPCGQCGPDLLSTCDCDMPRGSVEVKGVILRYLESGMTEAQVIEKIKAEYGHFVGAAGIGPINGNGPINSIVPIAN